jgi:ribose transport system substrate-binding protein
MKYRRIVELAVSGWLCACGTSAPEAEKADVGGGPPSMHTPGPFASAAIEGVMDNLASAILAHDLAAGLAPKPPVAMLLKDLSNGFWQPTAIGANRMSARLACPSVVEAPLIVDGSISDDAKGDLQNQYIRKYLGDVVYKGLSVAPLVNNASTIEHLDNFVEQRGPVITIDSDSPTSERTYLIATANYQAGVTAANALRPALQAGDSVAVFGTADLTWPSGVERAQGAEDGAVAAGLVVTPRLPVVWDTDKDLATLVNAVSNSTLNLKGLLCMYSNSNLCAQAVEQAGKKGQIQIVGFDMENPTKIYFAEGYFYAIAVQRQYYMGQLGILVPYSILVLGEEVTASALQPIMVNGFQIDTGLDIITPDNYSAYMTFLSQLGING